MIISGSHGSRWHVRLDLVVDWDWWTVGVYWKTDPGRITVWGTILPPLFLVITETRQ